MNVVQVICIVVILMLESSQAAEINQNQQNNHISVVRKRSTTPPTQACTIDNEGESVYSPVNPLLIWLCKTSAWQPYELVPSTGKTKELSANNCKEIKEDLSTDCTKSPESGIYWVQDQQIYCNMNIDGGGWTLVWQHTYMKFIPLNSKMFYYSDSYRPCVKDASKEKIGVMFQIKPISTLLNR